MTNEQKRKQITAMFGAYSKRLEKLYDQFISRLTELAHRVGVGVDEFLGKDILFRFDRYPELRAEYNEIFKDYVQKETLAYRAGITDGVALAYAHDASVLSGFSVLSDKAIRQARNTAAETFIRNRMKPATGLSLSQLIWNYASQTKSEFEVAVSNVIADGLKKGTSAASLGLQVRQYLNNPDMMYRRYHRTVVDAQGNKRDIVKWRRRVVDDDGKVRFVEEPLEKVGMGHYRSSKRNSDRLMRTEINGAYHRANAERWQMEPFVIGVMIELSPQHPVYDECDELKGRYPKDFVFTGWHPQCLCMSNPITIQGDEKKDFYRRLAAGEDMSDYVSPNRVQDIPQSAKDWIDANRDKFIRAAERGKLGWVWRDNMKYVRRQFSTEELKQMGVIERPKEEIKSIRESKKKFDSYGEEWKKAYYNEKNGGYNVYHQKHQFANNKAASDSKMTGGEAEKFVGKLLADKSAKQIEFLPENGLATGKPDVSFDSHTWDIKYISKANQNTMRKYIEDARKAERAIFYWDEESKLEDLKIAVSRTIGKFRGRGELDTLPSVFYINKRGELICIFDNI